VDKDDYSVVRTEKLYKKLVEEAGLKVIKEEFQANWPEDLFDVKMYALQPIHPKQ
jgi:protein N-terminal methyltransferase